MAPPPPPEPSKPEPPADPADPAPNRAPPSGNERDSWWPSVATPDRARKTARYGFWATVINIVLTAAIFLIAVFGGHYRGQPLGGTVSILTGVELVLLLPIATGLWHYSRIAALAAPVVYLGIEFAIWFAIGIVPDLFAILLVAVFMLFYTHGIRGCFAVHRI